MSRDDLVKLFIYALVKHRKVIAKEVPSVEATLEQANNDIALAQAMADTIMKTAAEQFKTVVEEVMAVAEAQEERKKGNIN